MHIGNVDFVVDSKTTNEPFHSNKPDVSEFGQIISRCQRLFHSQFTNYWVKFNRRQTNVIAHALAKEVVLSTSLNIYFHIPRCILMILLLMKCYNHFFFKKIKMVGPKIFSVQTN